MSRKPCRRPHDAGTVTAKVIVMTLAVLALSGLVLDAGLAVSTKVNATSVAQAAARAGARELDVVALRANGTVRLDPIKAHDAATNWLTRAGLTGTVTVTGNRVAVSVTTSRRTQLLQVIGIGSIPVHADVTAEAIAP